MRKAMTMSLPTTTTTTALSMPAKGRAHVFGGRFAFGLIVMLLAGIPSVVTILEVGHRDRVIGVEEMVMSKNAELFFFSPLTENSREMSPVHAQGRVECAARDGDVGLDFDGAARVRRVTEYCQWQEIEGTCRSARCEPKGTNKRAGWSANPIASSLFRVSGNYFNPTEPPLPPKVFDAYDLTVFPDSDRHVYARVDEGLVERLRAKWKRVAWTFDEDPRFAASRWAKNLFVGHQGSQQHLVAGSILRRWREGPFFERSRVVYVGEGYFYQSATRREELVERFDAYLERKKAAPMTHLEIKKLFESCEPGDLRTRYEVVAPKMLSVLAVVDTKDPDGNGVDLTDSIEIKAILHAGLRDPDRILRDEAAPRDSRLVAGRAALFAWALAVAALAGSALGLDITRRLPSHFLFSCGITTLVLGLIWASAYGMGRAWRDVSLALAASVSLATFGLVSAPPSPLPPGMHAVWCLLAYWAGFPTSFSAFHRRKHGR